MSSLNTPASGELPKGTATSSSMDLSSSLATSLPSFDSSSPSGTKDGLVKSQDGTLPGIPLEILERILRYTFLRRTRLSPSSDPYPLRNTTHLLLVSKAFRELCLPIFFQHLTIARPSDYITFFNPENGLFVAGEEGRRRWSYVEVLGFAHGVTPPSRFPTEDDESWIVPLAAPVGDRLQIICFFDKEVCSPASINLDLEIIERTLKDERSRTRVLGGLTSEFHQSAYFASGGRQFDQWIQDSFDMPLDSVIAGTIATMTLSAIRVNQQRFHSQLVPSSDLNRPRSLRFYISEKLSPLLQFVSVISGAEPSIGFLYIYRRLTSEEEREAVASIFEHLRVRIESFVVHLVGHSPDHRPVALDRLLESTQEGQPSWRYVGQKMEEEEDVVASLLPQHFYDHFISDQLFEPLTESEELAWRGLQPSAVESKKEEESEGIEIESS
ncbi:hypothetical protein BDY24DRAFT_414278 [Mrakia frigida]|uniref:uncharacterized protein n=1 Tax=Mrakia frigida TaxID=29902 RepID=UPI003FCBFA31